MDIASQMSLDDMQKWVEIERQRLELKEKAEQLRRQNSAKEKSEELPWLIRYKNKIAYGVCLVVLSLLTVIFTVLLVHYA